MMRTCGCVVALTVVFSGVLAWSGAAQATRPAAGGFTWHDFYREIGAYNRKVLVEAYRAKGLRNPKWDAAAEETLDLLGRRRISADAGIYAPLPLVRREQVRDAASKAIGLGCDDPLVAYAMAFACDELIDLEPAKAHLRKAYAAIASDEFAPTIRSAIASRMRAVSPPGAANDATVVARNALAEAACGPFMNASHQRHVYFLLQDELADGPADAAEGLVRQIERRNGVDPWIAVMLRAKHEDRMAWASRGHGWASEVTAEGRRGFQLHMDNARASALAAYRLKPGFPDSSNLMIDISMAQSDHEGVLEWFENAIKAQPDCDAAYSSINNALLPRWGGTHEQILQAGVEAARSRRYDTLIPYQYIRAVRAVARDAATSIASSRIWRLPHVRTMAGELLDGYAEHFKGTPYAAYFLLHNAVLQHVNGDDVRAAELLDRAGEPYVQAVFDEWGIRQSSAVAAIYLVGGAHSAGVRQAMDRVAANRLDEARIILKKTLAGMDSRSKAYEHVSRYEKQLDLLEAFSKEAWVSLLEDPQYSCWLIDGPGLFKAGEVICGGMNRTSWMSHRVRWPGRRYEVVLRFELLGRETNPKAGFAMRFGLNPNAQGYGIGLYPAAPENCWIKSPNGPGIWRKVDLPPKNELRVTLWDQGATAVLNGVAIDLPRGPAANPEDLAPNTNLQIGGLGDSPCPQVKITEVKIRKLVKQPE